MKKNNQKKESLKLDITDLSGGISGISNPIPSWMKPYFKTRSSYVLPDINECVIEGYPIDDEF